MAETQTVRMNIDGSGAARGAAQYAAAIDKIASATKNLQKTMQAASSSMGKTGSFSKVAKDLAALNNVKLNTSLAKNLMALSAAMAAMRSPSASAVRNTTTFLRSMSNLRLNTASVRQMQQMSAALGNFRGPNASAVNSLTAFFRTINSARITGNIGQQLASISSAINNFRGPNPAAIQNLQRMSMALSQLRVPAGVSRIASTLNGLNSSFARTGGGALRLGGSVNAIPWGRASAGGIQLTGNMRGLENAFSLAYQAGSQLRTLFGALTISNFTKGVYDSTIALQRFQSVMGVVIKSPEQMAQEMEFLNGVAGDFGISLDTIYDEFGKFAAAAKLSGQSLKTINYMFETVSGSMRVMGLSAEQQRLVFLALEQGFSKGTVSMEELKRQFGEQIPGAFELMQNAIREKTGQANANLAKLLQGGKVTSDAWVLLAEQLEKVFGPQFLGASKRADSAVGRLTNTWTVFQQTVGKSGVVQAIGQVADKLAALMATADFQKLATDIGQGLGNAILKVGDALVYVIQHARELSQIMISVFAGKAAQSAASLVATLLMMGGNVGRLALAFVGIGRAAEGVSRLGMAFGLLGPLIGTAVLIGTTALGLMWDKTVQIGDQTAKVGDLAKIVWTDFSTWAIQAAQIAYTAVLDAFKRMDAAMQAWADSMNNSLGTQGTSWQQWLLSLGDAVVLLGETMGDVFQLAWKVFVGGAIAAGKAVGAVLGATISATVALGYAASGQWALAGIAAKNGVDTIKKGFDDVAAYGEDVTSKLIETFKNAHDRTLDVVKEQGEISKGWQTAITWASTYEGHLAAQNKILQDQEASLKRISGGLKMTGSVLPRDMRSDHPDDDALKVLKDDAGSDSVAKRLKSTTEALADYNAELKAYRSQLINGRITQDQFDEALVGLQKNLEDTADPYASLIRNMQEENNMLRLNDREQRQARELEKDKQDLLKKGIVLTQQQTDELKKMIAVQDELQNPHPLQAWVDGIMDFRDAVETAGVSAMDNLTDALADFVVDGKADWESLFKGILKDLIKLSLNQVWKQLFSSDKSPQAVNAPMTGALATHTFDMTPGGNVSVMASAVTKGIVDAQGVLGGGLGSLFKGNGAGSFTLGNDIGPGLGSFKIPGLSSSGNSDWGINSPWVSGGGSGGGGSSWGLNSPWASGGGFNPLPAPSPLVPSTVLNPLESGLTAVTTGLGDVSTAANGIVPSFTGLNNALTDMIGGIGSGIGGAVKGVGSAALGTESSPIHVISVTPSGAFAGPGGFIGSGQGMAGGVLGGGNAAMGNMVNLSNTDIANMAKVLKGEWSLTGSNGGAPGGSAILDVMLNRAGTAGNAYGQKNGMFGVLSQANQFDAVTKAGGLGNMPVDPKYLQFTQDYLSQRAGGAPSMVGNSVNYLNPAYSSAASMKGWGNSVVGQAQQTGYEFGNPSQNYYHDFGVAPGAPTPGAYGIGLPGGMGAGMSQAGMAGGAPQPMPYTARPGFGNMVNTAGQSSGSGFSGLPGGLGSGSNGGAGGTGAGGMGGGDGVAGVGKAFKADMEPAFQDLSKSFPKDMDPGVQKTADLLPKKMTENSGDQFQQAMQPAAQQSAQTFQQSFSQVIQQLAQEMQQAMSQAIQSASSGGGLGGLGGIMGGGGGLGGILGGLFDTGGVVGGGGHRQMGLISSHSLSTARSMKMGGIVGDPDAEPIIAHKGELVVPANQVAAMRRLGPDVGLADNAAVSAHASSGYPAPFTGDDRYNMISRDDAIKWGHPSPVVNNWNISTPDANSFRESQKQIEAKQGASLYRNARRNN